MNFTTTVIEAAPRGALALVEISAEGARCEYSFGEVAAATRAMASTLAAEGVQRGDVVMTLIGNTPHWVFALLASFRQGLVSLPCAEQLTASDLRYRFDIAEPAVVVCHRRNAAVLHEAGWRGPTVWSPDWSAEHHGAPVAPALLAPDDPALITFTSGTSGPAKAVVHGHRYLLGQGLQADHWLSAHPGDLVWCTAASGWSKSARNAFIAPWLRGSAVLLHDARFDPAERVDILRREHVNVLCMSPTEYRVIAKGLSLQPFPHLREMVAAGEALDADALGVWRDGTGLDIRDGYGQTETGQITANPAGKPARAGSMGKPLPGVVTRIDAGELVVKPATVPTFFLGYLGEETPDAQSWRTGDRVREDDEGYLYFIGRDDDVIISSGYRIGPFEVESALLSHPAVADVAVVAYPDPERGNIVRAVVVPVAGVSPSDALGRELQDHVKQTTAPYKYPRIVEFVDALPRTSTGKVRRAALRLS